MHFTQKQGEFLNFATPFDFHYHDRLVFLDLCRLVKKLIF